MDRPMRSYLLIAVLILLLFSGCSYHHESYSILESVPYLNYRSNASPELVDGSTGFGIGIGGAYAHTATDSDTSVSTFVTNMSLRANLGSIVEVGVTPSFLISDDILPYGIFDAKFKLAEQPVIINPSIGFGAGFGRAGFMGDARMLVVFGVSLLDGLINPYVAPKLMMFLYPYELSGYFPTTTKRTMCGIYGLDAGMSFSIPIGKGKKSIQKLKIMPEFTYVAGKEPKGEKMKFSITRFGASLLFAP
ncbi:hypothetical protein E3J62_04550 [candidate division TA06 bacterium]|uniref:Outer membrane protein beta-barrel domain-containing protein n=1 Tax=candidate division TA06 bacterium TaxID=2250710 RepID=A0A523UUV4_UNCT6|nr:MAG: hypothetical protein E3J62_04550 [candidate division TA06 bacterium]